MTKDEIKKLLYKTGVLARFERAIKDGLIYSAHIGQTSAEHDSSITGTTITFQVPFSEIGDTSFWAGMPAKLLIRYLVTPETTQP